MLAFDPLMGEVREFDLYAGDVFQVRQRPFLVACPDDSGRGSLSMMMTLLCVTFLNWLTCMSGCVRRCGASTFVF